MASTGYETNLSETPLNQPNEELQPTSAENENIEHKVISCEHEVLKATRARGVNAAGSGGILDDIARDQNQRQ